MDILNERIKDRRFMDLIRKSLKAGYMEATTYYSSLSGTPQGSILSPLLCNVYMDKLDKFVENIKAEFQQGKRLRHNPAYVKLTTEKRKTEDVNEKRKIQKKLAMIPSLMVADPQYRRLMYVRYADD